MDKMFLQADRATEKAREICNKIYGLRPSEYFIETEEQEENTVTIKFNCEEKSMDSRVIISVEDGGFQGFISVYPALNAGKTHTLEEIIENIKTEGIETFDQEQITSIFNQFARGNILEHQLIAEGIKPHPGKDAEITIHFSEADNKPKIVDGKVDYKNLDNIVMVKRGDVLITKKPAVQGVKGRNIKGEEVSPLPAKDVVILPGDGATVNETGTIFTATVDGYVDYGNKRLGVYPVYIVKANVDYSTGNIKFNGSVHIKGDVLSGFKVEADRHILVDGICQDCELIAKGNVILRSGMKCSGEGIIRAGGNVVLGYAEKAKVYSRDEIEIKKYAYNCDLFAGSKVTAMNGDGIVAGGTIKAFREIAVKQLGTNGNSKFNVIIGMKYYIEIELERLRKEKARISETVERVNKALSRFNLNRQKVLEHPKIKKMIEVKTSLTDLLKALDKREEELIKENKAEKPKIKVKNMVYDGVSLMFYNVPYIVKEKMENMVFYYDEKFDDVSCVSLSNKNAFD